MSVHSGYISTSNNNFWQNKYEWGSWNENVINENKWPKNKSSTKLNTKGFKNKRQRTMFTEYQIEKLQEEFSKSEYISKIERVQIGMALKLSERQILVWFQNRRMKKKRDSIESNSSFEKQNENIKNQQIIENNTEVTYPDVQYVTPFPCYYKRNTINSNFSFEKQIKNIYNEQMFENNTEVIHPDEPFVTPFPYYAKPDGIVSVSSFEKQYENNQIKEMYENNTEYTCTDKQYVTPFSSYDCQENYYNHQNSNWHQDNNNNSDYSQILTNVSANEYDFSPYYENYTFTQNPKDCAYESLQSF